MPGLGPFLVDLCAPIVGLGVAVTLGACSDRYCTDPDVCWATKGEIIAAADRCGKPDFEPVKAGDVYSAAGQPYDPELSNCIVDDLKGQGLMVTH